MKALEILKEYRSLHFGWNETSKREDIDEAIAELEEAMKPKTCKFCAYCEHFNSVCFNDKSPLCADSVNSEYGCIYWEEKATT